MKVKDITSVIETFAPLAVQEEWDNSGLCIGSEDDEVHGVLLGLDCTEELVAEAAASGADLIVTHHPLLFRGIKKIGGECPVSRTVMEAIRQGVKVYAAHTNADKVVGGVSWAMAEKLALQRIAILDPEAGGAGLGAVGEWPAGKKAAEALAAIREAFHAQCIRTSKPLTERIRRVAMCGGSGASLIQQAQEAGAQLYISADISYHHFFTPAGFMIADIGHFESEAEIVSILFSLLRKNFPTFAVRISENMNHHNPIYYY